MCQNTFTPNHFMQTLTYSSSGLNHYYFSNKPYFCSCIGSTTKQINMIFLYFDTYIKNKNVIQVNFDLYLSHKSTSTCRIIRGIIDTSESFKGVIFKKEFNLHLVYALVIVSHCKNVKNVFYYRTL